MSSSIVVWFRIFNFLSGMSSARYLLLKFGYFDLIVALLLLSCAVSWKVDCLACLQMEGGLFWILLDGGQTIKL